MCQNCDSFAAAFCCKDVGTNGPNNKHSLEHLWHVGSTTSTVASLRVARLGWLPSQAELPLRDGRRRTWQTLHCSWNVTSTIRKTRACPTQTWIALGKLVAAYNFAASLFCTAQSLLRNFLDPTSLRLSQNCDSFAAAFCCIDVGTNWRNNQHSFKEHLWHVGSTSSTVASLWVARLGWLPRQAKLPLQDGWHPTLKLCHCSWTVKSTIRKAKLPQQTRIALRKLLAAYNFAASLFCTAQSLF